MGSPKCVEIGKLVIEFLLHLFQINRPTLNLVMAAILMVPTVPSPIPATAKTQSISENQSPESHKPRCGDPKQPCGCTTHYIHHLDGMKLNHTLVTFSCDGTERIHPMPANLQCEQVKSQRYVLLGERWRFIEYDDGCQLICILSCSIVEIEEPLMPYTP